MSGSDELARKRLANGNACQTGSDAPVANGINNTGQKREITRNNHVKVFKAREALTTKLVEGDHHFQAIYDAVMVQVILFITYQFIRYSYDRGYPYFDLSMLFVGLGSVQTIAMLLCVWACLLSCAFLVHPCFLLWKRLRGTLPHQLVDISFALLYVGYVASTLAMVTWVVFRVPFPPYSSIVATIEQLRLTMKSYSFVRENAYKVLYPWHKEDSSGPAVWYKGQMDPKVGSFSQYLYFLFAPTLLYRDHYPRTERVRKSRLLSHLAKTAIAVAFITILNKELFDNYPISGEVTRIELTLTFLSCLLYGLIMQFFCGYFFLHCWSNLFGELLRFADREFYSDWWTCTSFSTFYRKWNLLVHDWIKAYIYQDFKDFFKSKIYNKIASLPTIIISALFHEYVLWAPLRFFLPVLLIQYGAFGALLFFFRVPQSSKFWNYFLHTSINCGVAIMIFCYATEFYARQRCPKEVNFVNTFTPRTFECLW